MRAFGAMRCAAAVCATVLAWSLCAQEAPAPRASSIAVTFDDLPVATSRDPLARQRAITRDLVRTLSRRGIPAVGFVNGEKLMDGGTVDPRREALLDTWAAAGFELGNHTFSHPDLHKVDVAEFTNDIERGAASIRPVLERHHQQRCWFRHPFLHTGRSIEVRSEVERFLAARGCRIAPVTIDNSDYLFARAYDRASRDRSLRGRLVREYVAYMLAKVEHYDRQSQKLFGRTIPHVLLVHASALNARAFAELADSLTRAGHRFIPLDQALADEAYRSDDRWFGGAGISWIDRWALARGVPKEFFAGEPETPGWVLAAAGVKSE